MSDPMEIEMARVRRFVAEAMAEMETGECQPRAFTAAFAAAALEFYIQMQGLDSLVRCVGEIAQRAKTMAH